MATEILRPQDCLIERISAPPAVVSRRRTSGNNCNYHYGNHYVANSRSSRKPATRPEQRKRVVGGGGFGMHAAAETAAYVVKRLSADDSRMARNSGASMEKVTILRRGTSLDSSPLSVKTDMYAGSAFSVSPSPSALPIPSFSTRKQRSPAVDDSATRDLRRLLRLE